MLTLAFPTVPCHELSLRPNASKLGFRPKTITSKVLLGEPAVAAIHEDTLGDDLELQRFFADQKSQWTFHAVQLSCSFAAGAREIFERVHVGVVLSSSDSLNKQVPIAWSMSPLKLIHKIEVAENSFIGSDLKFIQAKLGATTKETENELYVIAYNEQRSDPYWRLKSIPAVRIEGVQRFRMIVRVPRHTIAAGRLSIQADIRAQRFLVPCEAPIPDIPHLSFTF